MECLWKHSLIAEKGKQKFKSHILITHIFFCHLVGACEAMSFNRGSNVLLDKISSDIIVNGCCITICDFPVGLIKTYSLSIFIQSELLLILEHVRVE